MKNKSILMFVLLTVLAVGLPTVSAQITIKIPKIKSDKPKQEQPKTSNNTENNDTNETKQNSPMKSDQERLYPQQEPTNIPILIKNSIHIKAWVQGEYWKMPNQENYSSWQPRIEFDQFYNNDKDLSYKIEYFNPDGSPWFSQKLGQSGSSADRMVTFRSPSLSQIIDTNSTTAIGVFSFKITNADTNILLFQGKFKVGKYSRGNRADEKNKMDFYVEHDWLLPLGMIGFHHSGIETGGVMLEVSIWLKGMDEANELEGRIFYQGKQITSTKEGGGATNFATREAEYAAAFKQPHIWKGWQFQWDKFLLDNNAPFNRYNYPNAHYFDKNPGEYTVKIYRNGIQIRELSFTVGADGRYIIPAYTNQIPLPYHRIILPVKITDPAEKWNSTAWKTDAFYGNPLNGFSIP